MTEVAQFLDSLYAAAEDGLASDLALEHLDGLLSRGKFAEVDEILVDLDQTRVSSAVRRIVLCATYRAKDKLRCRAPFFDRALSLLAASFGHYEASRRLRTLE